ncbi:MAG: hypothetical protein JJLCMIEE_03456 [Acidimicrobiales bacterium]|nr:MAG: hypothetical protein EDR02_15320 [Actinomycetota bacterium]MBV6510317.1 hypothetical protein [Acidimicrobiales bacterium]RIK03400.1 MAG: hypothetical protein DCC48_16760 [Acidobacteriota bacterium]
MNNLVFWIVFSIVVVTIISIAFTVVAMKWSWNKADQMVDKSMNFTAEQQQQWLDKVGPVMDSQKDYMDALAKKEKRAGYE